jgi:hypothetical protein
MRGSTSSLTAADVSKLKQAESQMKTVANPLIDEEQAWASSNGHIKPTAVF